MSKKAHPANNLMFVHPECQMHGESHDLRSVRVRRAQSRFGRRNRLFLHRAFGALGVISNNKIIRWMRFFSDIMNVSAISVEAACDHGAFHVRSPREFSFAAYFRNICPTHRRRYCNGQRQSGEHKVSVGNATKVFKTVSRDGSSR